MMKKTYYMYLRHGRVIKIVEDTFGYEPVSSGKVEWFRSHFDPPFVGQAPISYEWTFTLSKGFERVDVPVNLEELNDIQQTLEELYVLEKYNGLALTYKLRAFKGIFADQITYVLLFQEVQDYKTTGEIGPLLMTTHKEVGLEIEAYVAAIELKRRDMAAVFAYLIELRRDILELLKTRQIVEANNLITQGFQKIKM